MTTISTECKRRKIYNFVQGRSIFFWRIACTMNCTVLSPYYYMIQVISHSSDRNLDAACWLADSPTPEGRRPRAPLPVQTVRCCPAHGHREIFDVQIRMSELSDVCASAPTRRHHQSFVHCEAGGFRPAIIFNQ